jgi:hypothetical protein
MEDYESLEEDAVVLAHENGHLRAIIRSQNHQNHLAFAEIERLRAALPPRIGGKMSDLIQRAKSYVAHNARSDADPIIMDLIAEIERLRSDYKALDEVSIGLAKENERLRNEALESQRNRDEGERLIAELLLSRPHG